MGRKYFEMGSALTGFPLVGKSGVRWIFKSGSSDKIFGQLCCFSPTVFSWILILSASVLGPDIKLGFLSETSSFFLGQ